MQVTVLGKSPAWQDAAGACSGYLIRHDGFTLLLDCGNGVFGKLRAVVDYVAVDAVLLTHLHADHFFDVVPWSFALGYGPRAGGGGPALHAPPGAGERFAAIGAALGDASLITRAFALHEYDPAAALTLGPLEVRMCEVPHYVPTHAMRITAPGGGDVTFGADCRPNDALPALAADSELLFVEATLHEPETVGTRGHLTAREAGEHGRAASASRLVLTHFSDELDRDRVAAEGRAGFGAAVTLAHEGATFTL